MRVGADLGTFLIAEQRLNGGVDLKHHLLGAAQSLGHHASLQAVQGVQQLRILEALQVAVERLDVAQPLDTELGAQQRLALQVLEVVKSSVRDDGRGFDADPA